VSRAPSSNTLSSREAAESPGAERTTSPLLPTPEAVPGRVPVHRPGSGVPASGAFGKRVFIPLSTRTLNDAFACLERRDLVEFLASEFGQMLQHCTQPDHFVTLTLRDRVLSDGAKVNRGREALDLAWRSFCRVVRRIIRHRFEFFYVVELQERGVPHIHALLWNTSELNRAPFNETLLRIEKLCHNMFGRTQLDRFDMSRGGRAGSYLAKYLFSTDSVNRLLSCSKGLAGALQGNRHAGQRPSATSTNRA
jgi:hypothetical protein